MQRITPWLEGNRKVAVILALIMLVPPTALTPALQTWAESPIVQNATLTAVGIEYVRIIIYPLFIRPVMEMLPQHRPHIASEDEAR